MSDIDAAPLALAQEHVRKGLEIVAAQRVLIDRIRFVARDTEQEESLLRTFENTLVIFEQDLERLSVKAGR